MELEVKGECFRHRRAFRRQDLGLHLTECDNLRCSICLRRQSMDFEVRLT